MSVHFVLMLFVPCCKTVFCGGAGEKWMVVGSHQEFIRTDRYMLITDGNGYERDNIHSANYNKPRIGNYSKELFWENAKNNAYSFVWLVWKN